MSLLNVRSVTSNVASGKGCRGITSECIRLEAVSWRRVVEAFWNRWTLGLSTGLWTEISAQKHTKFGPLYLTLDLCV